MEWEEKGRRGKTPLLFFPGKQGCEGRGRGNRKEERALLSLSMSPFPAPKQTGARELWRKN